MLEEIRQHLYSQPFVPFTIRVTDGLEYHVPTADHAHIHPSGMRIIVWTDDNRQHILPLRQISGMVVADLSESPEKTT